MSKFLIDPSHSVASFSIKHMMIANVHGSFDKLSGYLEYDSRNLANSKVEVIIEASSINTREEARDTHLKSPDFFDVAKFPTIIFKSKRVESLSGKLEVIGDLSIHGVTNEVKLIVEGPSEEIKDPWGNIKIGASASTHIRRKDYGLTWNAALEAGGFLVGDGVDIKLEVQFVKQV